MRFFLGLCLVFLASGVLALPPAGTILVQGKPEFLLGANYAWGEYGEDLDHPNLAQIESDFADMEGHGVRALRWWLFADASRDPRPVGGPPEGVGPRFNANMRSILNIAAKHRILIEWSVLDFYIFKRGRGALVADPGWRKAFLQNVMTPILDEFGNDPSILGWDAMNEPDWAVRKADGGDASTEDTTTLAALRDYVNDLADLVHAHSKQYVTVGCASIKWLGAEHEFWNGLRVDYYEAHYYGWMKEWFDPAEHPYAGLKLDKPCVMGEIPGDARDTGTTPRGLVQNIYDAGYAGAWMWMWRGDGAMEASAFKSALLEFSKGLRERTPPVPARP